MIAGMAEPFLEVIDVRHRYGNTVALQGVSFTVAEGELFGLLGPNGAGKTTLMSVLSGLLTPTGGEVRLHGRPLRPDDRALKRWVGIVPQELAIYNELTARENLAFFGKLYGLRGPELRGRVGEVLAAVALADRADERVSGFSGGMKRRLNLGVALVHRPQLLLLDEPTTGVDPQSRNHIFEEVRRLNDAGLTVLYTSHYMEEVQTLCRRVGILDNGRLVACDTLPALLRRLPGRILLRVEKLADELRRRLAELPGVRVTSADGPTLELACDQVAPSLLRLLPVLAELQIEPTALETQEPNLERVFLSLTGRALRD
jgi:ABC-2 type transport system ATP-binding protein